MLASSSRTRRRNEGLQYADFFHSAPATMVLAVGLIPLVRNFAAFSPMDRHHELMHDSQPSSRVHR